MRNIVLKTVVLACVFASAFFTACPQPTDSPAPAATYTITVEPSENGSVSVNPQSAAEGQTVTVAVTPNENYEIKWLHVNGAERIPVTGTGGAITFTMPAEAVTVSAAFISNQLSKQPITIDEAIVHGTVFSSHETAAPGVEVFITPAPDDGYEITSVNVSRQDDLSQSAPAALLGGMYWFTMPEYPVLVTAVFVDSNAEKKTITIADAVNGSVTSSHAEAAAGTTVTITTTPDAGYQVKTIQVRRGAGMPPVYIDTADAGNNRYTFVVPAEPGNIRITVTFESLPEHTITIVPPVNGAIATDPADKAYETGEVTITLTPAAGYKYRPGRLVITGAESNSEIDYTPSETPNMFTFIMPTENVSISAQFVDENVVFYGITVTQPAQYGTIEILHRLTEVEAAETVTVILKPQSADYRYQAGSLSIPGATELTDITAGADGINRRWTFRMPAAAVTVSAVFEEIPAHPVTCNLLGEASRGALSANPLINGSQAREGKTITVTVSIKPADMEDYRYKNGSISITPAQATLTPVAGSANQWTFIMPPEAVTINAEIEIIPFKNIGKGANDAAGHGAFTLIDNNGTAITGATNNTRPGKTFTVTASPARGWKVDNAPSVTPAGAVVFTPVTGESNRWTFVMGESDCVINVGFVHSHELELYKGSEGGLMPGVTQDYIWGYYSGTQLDYNTVPGRSTGYALSAVGGVGENCIGLFPAQPIDLSGITALSFWVKVSNDNTVNTEFMGFGADENAVVYKTESGSGTLPIQTTDWKRYIIPVPYAKPGATANRIFIKINGMGADTSLYFDDIEFIVDNISLGIEIPSSLAATVEPGVSFNAADLLSVSPKLKYTHDDGTFATLTDNTEVLGVRFIYSNWNLPALQYEVDGNASISNGVITTTTAGTFNLYAKIGNTRSNPMAVTIAAPPASFMIDDFEGDAGSAYISNGIGSYPRGGERYTGTDAFDDGTSIAVSNNGYAMTGNGWGGKNIAPPLNVSRASKIVFWAWSSNLTDNTFTFKLKNGTDTPSYFSKTITLANTGAAGTPASWNKIEILLTELVAEAGGVFDPTRVTGYVYAITGTGGGTHAIDNLRAEE
jgi:hypothetical protein